MIVFLLLIISSSSYGSILGVDTFLNRVKKNFPNIEAQHFKVKSLEAKLRKAQGLFDSNINLNTKKYTQGHYDLEFLETSIDRPLQFMNSEVSAGFRKSSGKVPVYYSELETDKDGESFLTFKTSLLRYRSIDPKRFNLFLSKNNLLIQKLNWSLKTMDILNKANQLYWKWVVNSEKLMIYQNLVKLNEQRLDAIKNRVDKKDLARIYLVESEQYLLGFKSELAQIKAENKVLKNLLLFYDPEFKFDDIPRYSIPKELTSDKFGTDINKLIENRPELQILKLMTENNKLDIQNANQKIMPKLDLKTEFVETNLNDNQQNGDELMIGLSVEIPIETNFARGEIARAKTDKKLIEIERSLTQRRLEYFINNLVENLKGLTESINFISKEVVNSETLQKAEWSKFNAGASDFFLINTRDMNYAKAKVKLIKSYAKLKELSFQYEQWKEPLVYNLK